MMIPLPHRATFAPALLSGLKLCKVNGNKRPDVEGWNLPGKEITDIDGLPEYTNAGILLAPSSRASIDLDDLFMAQMLFAERGIDLQTLLDAPDAVQIISGRPNSGKLLYAMPEGMTLPSKSMKIGIKTIVEFRNSTAEGKTVQDLCPGSKHPSGSTYEWGGRGEWTNPPQLPAAILAWWQELLEVKHESSSGATTLENLDEVKDALKAIPASVCHDDWLEVIMALHSTGHVEAYEVARQWSMTCPEKYPGDNTFNARWRSFGEKENGITIASLFYHAKEYGWVAPPKDVIGEFNGLPPPEGGVPVHPLLRYETGYSNEGTEFVIDGVIAEGPVILPADRGLGKTTAIVSLACKVAHLCPENDPLRPTIQRNVVYLTEDPKQVQRILYAMAGENQLGLDGETFDERFDEAKRRIRIVPTVRLTALEIVKVAEEYNKTLKVPNERNGVRYDAPPWVIFDTTSASIDLEEENSNSEIGKAVALMKSEFYLKREIPFLLVAHTAKAMKHADVSKLSARGGGAWEADVYQVIYMSTDDEGGRFLEIGTPNAKKRFSPKFYSIAIGGHRKECVVTNRFKEITTEWITWASLTPMTSEEVTGIKEKAEEKFENTVEEKAINKQKQRIRKFFEDQSDFKGSKNVLASHITGNRAHTMTAIAQLIADGELDMTEPDEESNGKTLVCAAKPAFGGGE